MPKATVSQRVEALRKMPFFSKVGTRALQKVIRVATEFDVPAGHVLVQPNTGGSGMYIIEEGTVVVELPRRRLELGPGEWVGELSLLTDRARSARVRAKTPVVALAIGREAFKDLLEEEPKLAMALLEVLAERLAASG